MFKAESKTIPINVGTLRSTILVEEAPIRVLLRSYAETTRFLVRLGQFVKGEFTQAGFNFRLVNAYNISSVVWSVGGIRLCRVSNPSRSATLWLRFFNDEEDCLLLDNFHPYYEMHMDVEFFDAKSDTVEVEYVPLIMNRAKLGQNDHVPMSLGYYLSLTKGDFLVYEGGSVAETSTKPTFSKELPTKSFAKGTNDSMRKKLRIQAYDVEQLVRSIPDDLCEQKDPLVYECYPPIMSVQVLNENENAVRQYCSSQDSTCRISAHAIVSLGAEDYEAADRYMERSRQVYQLVQGCIGELDEALKRPVEE